jgi:hypothetical protein
LSVESAGRTGFQADKPDGLARTDHARDRRYAAFRRQPTDIEIDWPFISAAGEIHPNQGCPAARDGDLTIVQGELEGSFCGLDDQPVIEAAAAAVHQVLDHDSDLILPRGHRQIVCRVRRHRAPGAPAAVGARARTTIAVVGFAQQSSALV